MTTQIKHKVKDYIMKEFLPGEGYEHPCGEGMIGSNQPTS